MIPFLLGGGGPPCILAMTEVDFLLLHIAVQVIDSRDDSAIPRSCTDSLHPRRTRLQKGVPIHFRRDSGLDRRVWPPRQSVEIVWRHHDCFLPDRISSYQGKLTLAGFRRPAHKCRRANVLIRTVQSGSKGQIGRWYRPRQAFWQ